jgi:hypothetical protein
MLILEYAFAYCLLISYRQVVYVYDAVLYNGALFTKGFVAYVATKKTMLMKWLFIFLCA